MKKHKIYIKFHLFFKSPFNLLKSSFTKSVAIKAIKLTTNPGNYTKYILRFYYTKYPIKRLIIILDI